MTTNFGRTIVRMKKELEELEDSPREGIICYPIEDDNITHLHAEISGPEDTPYFGGTFKIDIQIPERYPMEPPNCQFLTRVYHPNIDDQGRICLDVLKKPPKGNWGPAMSIPTVLLSLRVLLSNPNPDDPLLVEVAAEYKEDRTLFQHKAAKYTKQYAMGNDTETNHVMTSAETTSEPAAPTTKPLNNGSRESSQPSPPVVMEKRSLAKPMLKRPNLSMRSKTSACPSPHDTIPASSTGYLRIHNSQNGRDQETESSRSSTTDSSMSTPKMPELSTAPSEATTNLSRQTERATRFCEVTCHGEPSTRENSAQELTPLHNLTYNKRELAKSTPTARETSVPIHTERNIIEIEDEKVVKKAKLNDGSSTPTSLAPQSVSGPIPQVDLESVQPVQIDPQPEAVHPVELELQSEPTQSVKLEPAQQGEPVQPTSTSPHSTISNEVTPLKQSFSFPRKSKPSHPTSIDRPLQELPTEPTQMKLDRTSSQETILDLDMQASQELSRTPCRAPELLIIHSKYYAPSDPSAETDENKESGLATTNAFHSPCQSSSRRISSGKERKVDSDSSHYRADPPSGSNASYQPDNNLASIMSSISRKRSLLKKHR